MKKIFQALVLTLLATVICYAGTISKKGYSNIDLVTFLDDVTTAVNNGCISRVALAIGTNTTDLTVGTTPVYKIGGVAYTTTASNTIAFSAGHTALTYSQACYFALCADTSGVYSTVQGRIVGSSLTAPYPTSPSDKSILGYVKVVTASNGTFTPGTTPLSSSTITVTYSNACHRPMSLTVTPR